MSQTQRIFTEISEMKANDQKDRVVSFIQYGTFDYINELLERSTLHLKEIEYIKMEVNKLEFDFQAAKLIEFLNDCQVDHIQAGKNYNQTDILNKIKEIY